MIDLDELGIICTIYDHHTGENKDYRLIGYDEIIDIFKIVGIDKKTMYKYPTYAIKKTQGAIRNFIEFGNFMWITVRDYENFNIHDAVQKAHIAGCDVIIVERLN